MRQRRLLGIGFVFAVMAVAVANVSGAPKAASKVPLTPAGEKLLAKYSGMLSALRAETAKSLPEMDPKKKDAFLKAHAAVGGAKPYQDTNPAFAHP